MNQVILRRAWSVAVMLLLGTAWLNASPASSKTNAARPESNSKVPQVCSGSTSLIGSYGMLVSGSGKFLSGALSFDGNCNITGDNISGGVSGQYASTSVTGSYAPNSDGTYTLTLNFANQSTPQTYIVGVSESGNRARGIESDNTLEAVIDLESQFTSTSSYSTSNLTGAYVASCAGVGNTQFDSLSFDGNGNVSGFSNYSNSGGQGSSTLSGTYLVNSDGTFSGSLAGSYSFNGVIDDGVAEIQYTYASGSSGVLGCVGKQAAPAALSGYYGFVVGETSHSAAPGEYFSGSLYFDGAGHITGTNVNGGNFGGYGNSTASGTYVVNANNTITINLTLTSPPASTASTQTYLVGVSESGNEAAGIQTDGAAIATIDLQSQLQLPGTAYSTASLAGTYSATCQGSEIDLNWTTFDGNGNITTGTDAYDDGAYGDNLYAGTYTVNSDGTFIGNFNNGINTGIYHVYTMTGVLDNGTGEIEFTYDLANTGGVVGCAGESTYAPTNSNPAAASPTFSPAPGTFTAAQSVTLSDTTTGAVIYYTTNGAAPSPNSAVYNAPIPVSGTTTIQAIAVAPSFSNSPIAGGAYFISNGLSQAQAPTFSPLPGTFSTAQTVTLSDSTPGAVVYCTTNGTVPTATSAVCTTVTVNATTTINAIAVAPGYNNSNESSGTYTIGVAAATPTFNPAPGTFTGTVTVTLSDATPGATIYCTTNGIAPTTSSSACSTVTITSTSNLQAIAVASGYSNSAVASGIYTITAASTCTGGPALSGSYGFLEPATYVSGVLNFNGNCGLTGTLNGGVSGQFINAAVTGTYGENPDGTYALSLNIAGQSTPITYVVGVSESGNKARGIESYDSVAATVDIQSQLTSLPSGYSTASLAGTYAASCYGAAGAQLNYVTFDGNGNISGINPNAYNGTYSVNPNGTFYGSLAGSYSFTGVIDDGVSEIEYTYANGTNSALSCVGKQSSSSNLQGYYGFVVVGAAENGAGTGKYLSGSLYFNGAGGITGTNIAGGLNSQYSTTTATGSYVVNSNNTVTVTLNLASPASTQTFNVGVVEAGSEALGVETDGTAVATIDLQSQLQLPATPYNQASLAGTYSASCTGSQVDLNYTTFDGQGNITAGVNAYWSGLFGDNPFQGTYTVNSDGTFVGNFSGINAYIYSVFTMTGVLDNATSEIEFTYLQNGVGGVLGCVGESTYGPIGSLPVAAAPTFSPAPGTFNSAQTVSLSAPGAVIYYTTNGATPTTSSPVYSAAISVSAPTTIQAIAVVPGENNSPIAAGTYLVSTGLPTASVPTFSPSGGTYSPSVSVTLSDATNGASIYYTTNGTTPTAGSTAYTGVPIQVTATTTIQAIAVASGYNNSVATSQTYTIPLPPASTPSFNPAPGNFPAPVSVSLSDTTSGAVIHCTTDGTIPSASSPICTTLTVGTTAIINAIAVAPGYSNSAVLSGTYTINVPGTFTLVQHVHNASCAVGTTCTIPLNQNIATGDLLVFEGSVYPAAVITGTNNGGSFVPCVSCVGFDPTYYVDETTGGWILSAAAQSSSITVTLSTAASGAIEMWEYAVSGGTPGFDGANQNETQNSGSPIATPFTPSGSNDISVQACRGYLSCNSVTAPFVGDNLGSNYSWAYLTTPTNWSSPTWTLAGSTTSQLTQMEFGFGTLPCSNNTFVDFGGASGSPVSVAQLSADTHGWTGGYWTIDGNGADLTFQSSASQTLQQTTGRLCDGRNYTDSSVTGLQYLTNDVSTNVRMNGTNAVLTGSTVSMGAWYYSNLPPTVTSQTDDIAIFGNQGHDFVLLHEFSNGGNRVGEIECGTGTSVGYVPLARNTWYWVEIVYNVTGNHTMKIYNNTTPLIQVGSTMTCPAVGGVPPAYFTVGNANSDTSLPAGYIFDYDGLLISLDGTDPLLPTRNVASLAATPAFSPAAGAYTSTQSVTISDSTPGAVIYYTTNGSAPTPSSPVYNAPITVSATTTIEAIAVASSYGTSNVASATYTINVAATPTFSIAQGTYSSVQSVAISDTTPNAVIYYTTNGQAPTAASPVYSNPIQVNSTTTIQAIAAVSGYGPSGVASATYTINITAIPVFSVPQGTYNTIQTVSLSDSTPGAAIYYTTNGATPTTGSALYTLPLTVSASEAIQAIAIAPNYGVSNTATASYIISLTPPAPVFIPAPGTFGTTQPVTLSDNTPGATIYYTTNGTAPSPSSTLYTSPIPVSANTTINAIAVSGGASSAVSTGVYTIAGGSTTVNLASYYNVYAMTTAGTAPLGGGLGGSSYTYESSLLGTSLSYQNITFPLAAANALDGVTSKTITLPSGAYNQLYLLGTSVYGPVSASLTVTYSDKTTTGFSQNFSDWGAPKGYSGETTVISTANRITPTGATQAGPWYVYGYTFNLTPGKTAVSVTLPSNQDVIILAAGLGNATAATAPTFSPAPGNYTSAQSVTLSDTTSGATIYYTTNGTTPTSASTKYVSPIPVSATTLIEAIAVATNYSNSAVATGSYSIGSVTSTPTFSPLGGTYSSTQTVTLSDATPGAAIYYTTNGSTPTTGSAKYSAPITVSATTTLEAIASASGFVNSSIATAVYTIAPAASNPTFSPAPGSYTSTQTVTLSDITPGATIYYTTNGTAPTTGSAIYSSPITVSATETLEAIAIAPNYSTSATATGTYTLNLPTAASPTFSPAAGTFTTAQSVTLSDITSGAVIYYTTNGTTPTANSTRYTSAIPVSATTTIEAIAVANGYNNSPVASATYTINPPAATPTLSPAGGTYTTTQSVTLSDTTAGAVIYYTTNNTIPTTSSPKYASAITVSATTTLEAIAVAPGYTSSGVASATYTITPTAAAPTFSPAAGTYTAAQTVTLSDTTSGATIYYTTNGTTPTTSSTKYTAAITVNASETIEAIAVATGYTTSATATAAYTISANTAVNLASYYNVYGIATSGTAPKSGGFDNDSYSYNSALLGSSLTYRGISFTLGAANALDAVSNTTVALPAGQYSDLFLLGAAVNGAQANQSIVVTYSDGTTSTFTQTFSDWEIPQAYAGETTVAQTASRVTPSGSTMAGVIDVYGYTFALTAGKTVASVRLPANRNVVVLAMALGTPAAAAAIPTFSPVPGTYASVQSVSLSDATSGASIYYTTNGTTPTTSSTKYTSAISVSATSTLEAIAVASGYANSGVVSGTYTVNLPTAATPTFSVAGGSYTTSESVALADTTAGATIYYTTNGTAPTTSSTKYSTAILVSSTTTIEAIAVANGYNNSAVASATYTLTGTAVTPYIQVNGGAWQQTATATVAPGATVNLGPQPLTGTFAWTGPNGYTSTSRQINGIPLSVGTNTFVFTYTNGSGVKTTATFTITVT